MNRLVHIIAVLLVAFLLVELAQAQSEPGQKIRRELDRLASKIREAKRWVHLFPNPKIQSIIQAAEEQHQKALLAFQQRRFQLAVSHLKLGFTILKRLYLEVQNNPYFKIKFKDRMDQAIQQAEQIVGQTQNPDAIKLLNRAKYYRQKAFQLAASNQIEAALKNYFLADFFAQSAIRAAQGMTDQITRNLSRYFEDTRTMLLNAKELSSQTQNATIRRLVREAEKELEKATRFFESRHPQVAYQHLQIANRLLFRVLDLTSTRPAVLSRRVEMDLQYLEANIQEMQEKVAHNQSPRVRRLFERSVLAATRARNQFDAGKLAEARQSIQLANRLLIQIDRTLKNIPATTTDALQNQLATARTMFNTLQQNAPGDPYYQKLLALLQENLEGAAQAYQQNRPEETAARLKFFNSLALKLSRFKTMGKPGQQDLLVIQEKLQRLKSMLQNHPGKTSSDARLHANYRNAQTLYQMATQAFKDKRYLLCKAMINLASNLLTQ